MGHLLPTASISDYDQVIFDMARDGDNVVYLYEFGGGHYLPISGHTPS